MKNLEDSRNWNVLKEGTPKVQGVYVITYVNRTGYHTDVAEYNPVLGIWFWDEEEECRVFHKILAWQELPAPYLPEVDRRN